MTRWAIIFFTALILMPDSPIYGQDTLSSTIDTTSRDLKTENVEVIKAFEVKLADATMLKITPQPPEIFKVDKKYTYNISIVPYNIVYPDPVIRPLAMRKDEVEKYYENPYVYLDHSRAAAEWSRQFTLEKFEEEILKLLRKES